MDFVRNFFGALDWWWWALCGLWLGMVTMLVTVPIVVVLIATRRRQQ
jgi:hypothetical protein